MDEKVIFEKVNQLLDETDYPVEINDTGGLEEFLNDEDNAKYDVYEEIEQLYNELMEGMEEEWNLMI